jgi:chorismate mutase / prephenate dehydrogenase
MSLDDLRAALSLVDRRMVELMAERQRLVAQIGEVKRQAGRPLRDFGQEKVVLDRVRGEAEGQGLDPDLVEAVVARLIQASLERQEQDRVMATGQGRHRRALVVGGAGKMGRWFADFLDSQGFQVEISDPAGPVPGFASAPLLDAMPEGPDHDLVVISAPLALSGRLLEHLAETRPPGLIFDIGSLKSPLLRGLRALAEAGCRVTSVHPMFGPDTRLLSGRHVLFCDAGHPEATAEAKALFAPTMAERIDMPLEEHDRRIAYVLGLSHALNISFFTALARSGSSAPVLAGLSSTTFDAQLEVALKVAEENPHLYYEIQALNDHGEEALAALEAAVATLASAIRTRDEDAFKALMLEGRAYLHARRP